MRRTPLKRRKGLRARPSRSSQRRKADALFSAFIRDRDRICQAAGRDGRNCGGRLQCAHLEGRRNYRLRFEPMNAIALCEGHHRWYTDQPIAWAMFLERHFPEQYAFVRAHRNELWDKDLARVLAWLQAEGVGTPAGGDG